MFDGDNPNKRTWNPQTFEEDKLYTAYSAKLLLGEHSYQKYLEIIRNKSGVTQDDFENYYLPLINHFVEFVQVIPWRGEQALGGLLARGLENGYKVLLSIKNQGGGFSRRFKFAAFSDALLHFVDTVVYYYRIMIHDQDGYFIKRWQPFEGPMEPGTYYKIRPFSTALKSSGPVRALLAKSVMPDNCFRFIAEDLQLLNQFLALLDEDREGSGGLALLLQPIWARTGEPPKMLNAVQVETKQTLELQEAENFWQWLKSSIKNGDLTVNQKDSLVHRVKDGVFVLYPDVFEEYNRIYSRHINSIVLYKQFNHLGLTPLSGYDYKFSQYFATYPNVGGTSYNKLGARKPAVYHMVPREAIKKGGNRQQTTGQQYSQQMSQARSFLSRLRQNKPASTANNEPVQGEWKQGLVITEPGLVFDVNDKPELNQYFTPTPKPDDQH